MSDPAGQTLRIKLLESDHDVEVEELDPEPSPHTGRQLRRAQVSFRVSAKKSKDVSAELSAASEPENALSADGSRWTVASSSYSYEDDSPVHNHRAELHEIEEPPQAERVEMLGLTLVPSRYQESVSDEGILMVSLLVAPGGEDGAALESAIQEGRSNRKYFDVVRVGVSEEPLRARFGRCLWQRQDPGRLHLLRLVADSEEKENGASVFLRVHQPELGRTQRKIAALEDTVAALIHRLEGAGSLDEAEVAAIHESADGAWHRHLRDFDEAGDVESFF